MNTPPDPPVLFVTADGPDYLSDSLLHGLRQVLGIGVLDWPRKDMLYADYPERFLASKTGRGFTLYRKLQSVDSLIDRGAVVARLRAGSFRYVIFGSIQRQYGLWLQLRPHIFDEKITVAFLDGEDWPVIYPAVLEKGLRPRWRWLLPRADQRYPYYKRELTERSSRALTLGWRLRPRASGGLRPISFSIPEEWVAGSPLRKTQDFPRHIVDTEVAVRIAHARLDYPFSSEAEYFADLRASRFGVTMKRAGWDCLRHYELAASGTVMCFRDLDRKPNTCAPHGLNSENAISYSSYEGLQRVITRMSPDDEAERVARALAWARANTTRRRATEFLDSVGFS